MIQIFLKTDPETARQLDRIEALLLQINERQETMGLDLSRITSEVSEIGAAVAAVAQLLRDNAGDQAKVNELADQLDAHGKALEALIPAGEPTPDPVPAPEPVPTEPQPIV